MMSKKLYVESFAENQMRKTYFSLTNLVNEARKKADKYNKKNKKKVRTNDNTR